MSPTPPPALPGFFGRILCRWGSASPTCGTSERASPARCHGEESVFPTREENLRRQPRATPVPVPRPAPGGRSPGGENPFRGAAGPSRPSPARRRALWRGCGSCPSAGSPGRRDRPRSGGGNRRLPGRRPATTATPAPRRHLWRARRRPGAGGGGGRPARPGPLALRPHLLAPPPGRGP